MWRPDQPMSCRFSSASTMQGRFYFSTVEGYILQVRLCPEPRVVPVVVDQPNTDYNMFCYLVPPDDDRRCGGRMLMVRYYLSLDHLSADERRIMKRRRKVMDVIRVEHHVKAQRWNLIQVFEVDVAGKRLVPVEDIGRHRAVFVGEVACFSLSARRFPCVAGNAVYMGHAVPAALPSACGIWRTRLLIHRLCSSPTCQDFWTVYQ
uniref:KIB1-4 beta-propeller domain-containing protein n=1 Tax=Aegilops tauschii subsp. strangulata TaxID=200361 RepID=A0A453AL95_AEGTS